MVRGRQNEHGGGARGIRKCKCDLCVARNAAWRAERRNGKPRSAREVASRKKYYNDNREELLRKAKAYRDAQPKKPKRPSGPRGPMVPHGGGATGQVGCLCVLCTERKRLYAREWERVKREKNSLDHVCPECSKNYFGLPNSKHPECLTTGYRVAKPGTFYVLYNEALAQLKGGIHNIGSNRIEGFQAHGFQPVFRFDSNDGQLVKDIETRFHNFCRRASLTRPYKSTNVPGGQRGHTEIYSLVNPDGEVYSITNFVKVAERLVQIMGP